MSSRRILEIKELVTKNEYRWNVGITPLSILPLKTKRLYLGYAVNSDAIEYMEREIIKVLESEEYRLQQFVYPIQWDWREVKGSDWTTPVKDQGECGSCVAFATIGLVESRYKIFIGRPDVNLNLSEADLFFCGCGKCCIKGWFIEPALKYVRDTGLLDEKNFPYEASYMPCPPSSDNYDRIVRISRFAQIYTEASAKEYLSKFGPLMVGMDVFDDFSYYTGGIYRNVSGPFLGNHAIVIVGYNEKEKYWICKNSWGSGWGEGGWFKLGYGECGIGTKFWFYAVSFK
ncbi:MAG TPA: C1 family peptidase [Candidatus Deferrimicrobium sp.]|nr:C1 family peptidase [Candidatus Deferrimicrobium sp.]